MVEGKTVTAFSMVFSFVVLLLSAAFILKGFWSAAFPAVPCVVYLYYSAARLMRERRRRPPERAP